MAWVVGPAFSSMTQIAATVCTEKEMTAAVNRAREAGEGNNKLF